MQPKTLEKIKREFQLSNCGFNYTKPDEFVRSQWQFRSKNVLYLIYRIIIGIFFLGAVIQSMAWLSATEFQFYFIYLTNWGIIFCMITSVFGAILVTCWYFHPHFSDDVDDDMPLVFKIYWSFHNTTLVLSIVITIIYWSILHTGKIPVNATNVLTHACNSAIMFLDMLVMAYPIRLYHVIQPIILGLIYVVFSVIHYAAGGTDKFGNPYIYNVLDWSSSDPMKNAVTVVGTLLLSMAIHIFLFTIYKLRIFIYVKCIRSKKGGILPTTSAIPETPISMVFSPKEYTNEGFSKSTETL